MEKERTGTASSSAGKSSTPRASDKEEIKNLKARIKGYHTLEGIFHDCKQQNKALQRENEELKRLLSQREPGGPSSLLQGLSSSDSLNSLSERNRQLMDNNKDTYVSLRNSGHASVASEHNELDVEAMEVNNVPESVEMEASHPTGEKTSPSEMINPSLEIDPYDLRIDNMRFGGEQSASDALPDPPVDKTPQGTALENVTIAASPSNLSDSIVLISPESWGNSQLVTQVREISEVLSRNVGLHSPSELSDALARLSINVLKVEKQLHLKQEMINSLSPENEHLKSQLETNLRDREKVISLLREEKRELERRVSEHEEALGAGTEQPGSPEWVHVGSPTQKRINENNLRWEERLKELESIHTSQVRQLQAHLADCRSRLAASENLEKKRQADIDKLLLIAKKRAEDEKASKEQIINQLYREEERRHQVEANLMTERRRAESLSDQVSALEAQMAILNESRLSSLAAQEQNPSLAVMSPGELRTEMQILRQQVNIFKEDFDRERSDRERIQGEKDVLQNAIARYKTDITAAQQKIRQLEQEKGMLNTENNCLRQEFQQIRQSDQDLVWIQNENRHLKEQLRQKIAELHRLKSSRSPRPISPQDAPWSEPPGSPSDKWSCTVCTFDNLAIRSSCEVCGRARRSSRPTNMSSRLIPHSPVRGWTECDTDRNLIKITSGDDLIIDEAEDQVDSAKK